MNSINRLQVRFALIASVFSALLLSCGNNPMLQRGDLIFEISTDSEVSKAITESTAQADSLKFSHVGIIDVDDNGVISVIEATGKSGVVVTPLDSFMAKATAGVVVKRLTIDFDRDESLARAKAYVGRGYDWMYLPDNAEIYCSELVEKSYRTSDGKPIFSTIPMNFKDKDGNIPEFWVKLSEQTGQPLPQGMPGTNPTQLSHYPQLIDVTF